MIDNTEPINFDSFQYVTGNDEPGRDPISWTLEISDDNIKDTFAVGISACINIIVGFPTETEEDFIKRVRMLEGREYDIKNSENYDIIGRAIVFMLGDIEGYNKAKETLYTKEELEEAMILMANFVKNAMVMPPESKIELTSKIIIQSLKQK